MKKISSILSFLLAVILCFSLSGCILNPTLEAPKNVRVISNLIRWDSVENAQGYTVRIENSEKSLEENTTELSFEIGKLIEKEGEVSIQVKARGDGSNYKDSEWTSPINYNFTTTTDSGSTICKTSSSSRYSVENIKDPYATVKSFCDEENYYYYFDLGSIKGVPLQENAEILQYNGNTYQYTFTLAETEALSISNTVEKAEEQCANWSETWSVNASGGIEGLKIKNLPGDYFAKIDVGYQKTRGGSNTKTFKESVEEVQSWSRTVQKTLSLDFSDKEKGYYRFIIMGDIQVTAVVIYSVPEQCYYLENYSVITAKYLSLDYSTTADFASDNSQLTFELDEQRILDLPIPPQNTGDVINYAGGYGTLEEPYLIATRNHLANIALNPSACFKLFMDIDLGGENIEPISDFSGKLDGDGYQICNFTITSSESAVGLFSNCSGTISKVTLSSAEIRTDITGSNAIVGALVGELKDGGKIFDCVIKNCHVSAFAYDKNNTESQSRYTIVGGIVGKNSGGEIISCTVSSTSVYGHAKKHDKAWSNGWDEAVYVYVGGVVGEFVKGRVNDNTVESLSNIAGYAEYRGNSAPLITIKTRSRIGLGGVIGRMDGSKVSQSGNVCQTHLSRDNATFKSYNSTAWIDPIEERQVDDIVGYSK